jgi:DNA-binding transcriptional MerR regulator
MDKTNNELIKITDLTTQLGLSSRSLRYYEQIGLIQSVRPAFEKYRFYDAENTQRLKQIMVLRKMQIPVKDILRIYESESMSVVVETFVHRIQAIDDEIGALAELKRIVGEFLHTMQENGVTKISALPLLYEEMDKQLELIEEREPVTYGDLSKLSDRLAKPVDPAIFYLPAMQVVSSFLKANPEESDVDSFWRWIQTQKLLTDTPGRHERFEYQADTEDVMIHHVPDDFVNDSEYLDFTFDGGLFTAVNIYLDVDLGERFRSLIKSFDDNKFYEIDYTHEGELRHPAMLENLISPDEKRELVALFVPVKKRLADPALFDPPEVINDITISEIEAANPILWEINVPLDKLTPIKTSGGYIRYNVLPSGEAIFSTYVGTRYLSTDIEVKLPFRVDFEFMFDVSPINADEGIRIHFGNCKFTINERNNPDPVLSKHAIIFNQPIFGNEFVFPYLGEVKKGEYNSVSWVIGEKYLSVIINGEVRFCAENLPYMKTDLLYSPSHPILINGGGDMPITIRNIKVSQLEAKKKTKTKKGELTMITKRSNNQISNFETYCVGERGENFAFDGACERLMECLGEKDFGYWLIAGITGDCFAQVYPKNQVFFSDRYCVSDYNILYNNDCSDYIEDIFDKMGYACTYVPKEKIMANKEMYRQTLMAYIDKGIPVIHFKGNYSMICGYEEHGNILLNKWPCSNDFNKFALDDEYFSDKELRGWIFVGEKKERKILSEIYRDAVMKMPEILTSETDKYYFGAKAFRAWADDIKNGFYDGKTQDEVNLWGTHTSFVCDFETIEATSGRFLSKALELNPDLGFISEIIPILSRQGAYANGGLEDLGGGFNVTLAVLQDVEKRKMISDRLRVFAKNMDEIVRVLKENI